MVPNKILTILQYNNSIRPKIFWSTTSFVSILLLVLSLSGCGKNTLTGDTYTEVNLFAPAATDTSDEAQLRRSFYDQTGAYLLFNDTLKHPDRMRILQIPYNVTITGSSYYEAQIYRLKYLTTERQRVAAADFIRTHVAAFVTKKAMPYSVLLVDTIMAYEYDKKIRAYNMDKPDKKGITVFGMQTLAIARLGNIGTMSEKEQKARSSEILNNIVKEVIMNRTDDETLAPFYAVSEAYYDKQFSQKEGNMPTVKDMKELGFIKCYRFKPDEASFYPARRDLEIFVKEILSKPEAQWNSEYADFPLVQLKLRLLHGIIEKKGISLNYL